MFKNVFVLLIIALVLFEPLSSNVLNPPKKKCLHPGAVPFLNPMSKEKQGQFLCLGKGREGHDFCVCVFIHSAHYTFLSLQ